MTTDSTSEDDIIPPPLPVKTREHSDYSNLPNTDTILKNGTLTRTKYKNRPLPDIPTTTPYDMVEVKNLQIDDKRRPPTPPPKPSRTSKCISAS